jgi:dipeptidyl aminopeptidase/acylaminoacyl peptidase
LTDSPKPVVAPHGSWPSALSAEAAAAGAVRFDGVRVTELADGTVRVRWQESRPSERGRGALCEWVGRLGERDRSSPRDLGPPTTSARSAVNEYGGGSWWDAADGLCFVDAETQQVHRLDPTAPPSSEAAPAPHEAVPAPVTVAPPGVVTRHASGTVTPDGRWMVCEREVHRGDAAHSEPVNELVACRIDQDAAAEAVTVVAGAHFVAAPTLSPDGRSLAWMQWDHPDMPWDAASLWAGAFDVSGDVPVVRAPRRVAGGRGAGGDGMPSVAVCLPDWSPDGELWWCDDRSDDWLLHRAGGPGLPAEGAGDDRRPEWVGVGEVGEPRWVAGGSRYGFTDDGRVVFAAVDGGVDAMWVATPGVAPQLMSGPGFTHVESVSVSGRHVALVAGSPTVPTSVWLVDVDTGATVDLRSASAPLEAGDISTPRAVTFPTTDGEHAHGLFHAPTSSRASAPPGELPPLVVRIHGGPTAAARAEFSTSVQFWTTRGFAVLEVDYRGSTGYGRRYRDLLRGAWGVADVEDCRDAARWLAEQGLVDGHRCVIRGGSAGGFTALAALVRDGEDRRSGGSGVFAAACSLYGVTDLTALAADTHKFESRYLDGLVGAWPEDAATYVERSPLTHVERIDVPVLILQGADDPVVPLSQAELLRDALAVRGVPHGYVVFPGEAHGFRRAANIVRALECELSFYGEVLGFTPDGQLSSVLARSTAVAPDSPET